MPNKRTNKIARITTSRPKGERRTSKPVKLFSKEVTVLITGTSHDKINKTASDIYSLQNEYTKGGRFNRSVQITGVDSSDIRTIANMKV